MFSCFVVSCLLAITPGAHNSVTGQPSSNTEVREAQSEAQEATLFSRLGHKETGLGKSAFSFAHGLRSDSEEWLAISHNSADLLYGSLSTNGNSDWFCVSMGGENPSKIKDLGEMKWSDLDAIPVLLATPPTTTGIRAPRAGESYEDSSEQRVTKAVAGHLYLVHIKNLEYDVYAVFRVETLSPNDSCSITWRVVASPEKEPTSLD